MGKKSKIFAAALVDILNTKWQVIFYAFWAFLCSGVQFMDRFKLWEYKRLYENKRVHRLNFILIPTSPTLCVHHSVVHIVEWAKEIATQWVWLRQHHPNIFVDETLHCGQQGRLLFEFVMEFFCWRFWKFQLIDLMYAIISSLIHTQLI